eukprot:2815584-Pyramimonas_sp.AAC.1
MAKSLRESPLPSSLMVMRLLFGRGRAPCPPPSFDDDDDDDDGDDGDGDDDDDPLHGGSWEPV